MKILFDTSVLVAALVESHPMHTRAFPWLKKARVKARRAGKKLTELNAPEAHKSPSAKK